MVRVDEVHGIFQALQLSPDTDSEPEALQPASQPPWVPLPTAPNWFFREGAFEREAAGVHDDRYRCEADYLRVKPQLDALFLAGQHRAGLALALRSFQQHGAAADVKRELVDGLAQFAIKCGDQAALQTCSRWMAEYCRVHDTGTLWLRIRLAQAQQDHPALRQACHEYLAFRPGEPEIERILAGTP